MGSQIPLMLASFNMKAKYQLLSLRLVLKYGLYSLESDVDYFMRNVFEQLVLRVGSSFWLNPTLNASPKPHLQNMLSCWHPCHTWDQDLGPHVKWQAPTSMLSTVEITQINHE